MKVLLLALTVALGAAALLLLLNGGPAPGPAPLAKAAGRGELLAPAEAREALEPQAAEGEARTAAEATAPRDPSASEPENSAFEQLKSTDFHSCLLHVSTAEGHTSPLGHAFAVYIGLGDRRRLFASGRTGADGKATVPIELLPGDDPRTGWGEVTTPGHLDARYALRTSGRQYVSEETKRRRREGLEMFKAWRSHGRKTKKKEGFDVSAIPSLGRSAKPRDPVVPRSSNSPRHEAYRLELSPVAGATVRVVFSSPSGERLRGRLFSVPAPKASTFDFAKGTPLAATVDRGEVSYRLRILEGEDLVYVGRASGSGTGVTTSRELLAHRSTDPFQLVIRGTSMVQGVLVDRDGEPMGGVELSLDLEGRPPSDPVTLLGSGAVTARATTDQEGQFEARGLRAGTFAVRSVKGDVALGGVQATAKGSRQRLSWPRAAAD